MKKRLLSALLALALVFVLLPTTALAKVVKSDEDISIAGIDWKFESDSEVGYFYNGNFTTTEPSDSYLKLTKNSNTITVTVYGNVTVSDIKVHKNIDIGEKINLIITGGNKRSTLTLDCTGISGAALETFQSGDITIKEGVTVNANFSANNTKNFTDCYGISASKNLIITGKGTTVNAVNADHDAAAVKVGGNITVSDGAQLNATNKYYGSNNTDKAYAIKCGQLSISGNNTKVTAYTSNGKKAISGTVNNGDKLTFKAADYKGSQIFLQRPMDEALGYKYVEITQAPTDPYVFIAGEPAIMGQETPIPGGTGTYLYKKTPHDGSFLTLKGVDITGTKDGPARFIQFGKNGGYYTIELEGENTISGFSSGIVAPNDPGVDDVTVVLSGSGSLDISAKQYAIDMQVGKLKFENTGKIKLTTNYNFVKPLNALHVAGNVFIDETKYDITGEKPVVNPTTENLNGNPNLDTILKGTSTDTEDLYFKTITITPAAPKKSTISYGGTTLKQGQIINGENGGKATVAPNGNTITLKNFNGTAALSFDATLADSTLVLEGTNTLSSIVTTQKGLTISGSGSLTVGSIKVHNQKTSSDDKPNLTINGATVTVGTAELTTRAIDIDGNLTVTNGSLKATSTSDSVPTVQVGGNASFTGSTVTITNNSTTQGERYKDSYEVSSALHVNGAITISGGEVTATATVGGNAIRAVKDITVSDGATVTAKNNSQYFNAITAGKATGGEVNTLYNLIVSGENTRITATNTHDNNLTYGGAINAYIKNANEGHYLRVGTDTKAIAPNVNTTVRNNSLTITRGDEVTRTNSPVVIAGTTLLNDTYYTITNGSKVAEGTESNYNAVYDSKTKTLKLNNASINGTGVKAIEANVGGYTFTIELVGNNIIKTSGFANNVIDITGNLYFTGSGTAEVSGKGTPIYATYKIDVSADVTITNTEKAGSFTFSAYGENSSNYKGANTFAIGTGYTAYATTDKTTWAVYDNTTASENESYTTLRITTQPPETGGGSTHQHTWDTTKWYDVGDGYHANKCTGCDEYDLTNKKAHVAWPDESKGSEGHTEKCMLCDYKYDQSVIKPHEWTGWWVSDYQPEVHAQRCNCGYQNSVHSTLKYVAIDSNYHQKQCPIDGCGYKIEYKTSHVYEEGSNICTECGYDKSAPCDHTGDLVYTNNGDGTHKVTCKACGATLFEKQNHKFDPATGACVCGATQSGGDPTPDNPGTIVIIRPAEEEKPAQQPNPSTGANDLVGLAVAAAVAAALGSAALLRKHD